MHKRIAIILLSLLITMGITGAALAAPDENDDAAFMLEAPFDEPMEDPWALQDDWESEEYDGEVYDTGVIENASFELFDEEAYFPDAWSASEWHDDERTLYSVVSGGIDGQYCAYIYNRSENDARFEQMVSVERDTVYRLRALVKASDVTPEAKGANISVLGVYETSNDYHETDGQWLEVELIGRTAMTQDNMTVAVRLGGYGSLSSGMAWFDEVTIERLDSEPADAHVISFEAEQYSTEVSEQEGFGNVPLVAVLCILAALIFFIAYDRCVGRKGLSAWPKAALRNGMLLTLALALLVRVILVYSMKGFPNDTACFSAWAMRMAQVGPGQFYDPSLFADYPPGYMLILYIPGIIREALAQLAGLDMTAYSALFQLLLRLPSIIADLLSAYIVYRIAKPRFKSATVLTLTALVALNPAAAFVSGGWGQIDSVLTLLLLFTLLLFDSKRKIACTAVYAFAVLVKPQALMMGPLLLVAFITGIFTDEPSRLFMRLMRKIGIKADTLRTWERRCIVAAESLTALLASIAVILLVSLPFTGSQQGDWLLDKLFSTATSYPYASVNAFNLFALFGGNWVHQTTPVIFGITYEHIGTAMIVLSVVLSSAAYVLNRKKKGALMLSGALLFVMIFTFAHSMHERYVFPAILLLCLSFVYWRDRRLYVAFGLFTVSTFFNSAIVYLAFPWGALPLTLPDTVVLIGSLLTVLSCAYLIYTVADITFKGRVLEPALKEAAGPLPEQEQMLTLKPATRVKIGKRGHLLMWGLTLAYAVVALVNLGTAKAPQTYWRTQGYSGEGVTAAFDGTRHVSSVWVYGGIAEGDVEFASQDELTGEWVNQLSYVQRFDDMFRWIKLDADFDAGEVTVRAPNSRVFFLEMAFFDENGRRIPVVNASGFAGDALRPAQALPDSDGSHLFDEQDTIPDVPSSDNGMYFDELYHGRTAYEHLNGLSPYENTHPPLGKVFIMLGIWLFGMSPFGWRIVGTLFGIFMVPLMYRFAKRLFKEDIYAFLAAFIFAFDFMHFAQTRIATIDTYGVFFIILMYDAMYQFYQRSWNADGLKKTLVPLGLAGVFFALGAASKWICIYSGIGLAVILFTALAQRLREYYAARRMLSEDDPPMPYTEGDKESLRNIVESTMPNLVKTLLFCVVVFIIIPVGVYLLSYMPYMLCIESPHNLSAIWDIQLFMFSYHSTLTATHPFQSSWWSWPLDIRPIWYFQHLHLPKDKIGSIVSFGNPAVWWTTTVGTISLMILRLRKRIKPEKGIFVVLIGLASQFLPWVPITRATFIYHFFASVPFVILATIYVVRYIDRRWPRLRCLKFVWMGVALALFIWFYPVLSGMPVSRAYAETLRWLPSWHFFS